MIKQKLKIAFVAGLSDKKLRQKILPLINLKEVESIDLYRRKKIEFKNKVRWIPLPEYAQNNKYLGELAKLLKLLWSSSKYDIIIGCSQDYHGVWAWIAGMIFHKPVIQLIITDVEYNYRSFLTRNAMLKADACGVRGVIIEKRLREYNYERGIAIIHNLVEAIAPVLTSSTTEKKYDLIAVGDYAEEKDYPWMMDVLSVVKKSLPNFKIAIAGNGHEKKLEHLIKKYQLSDNIFFIGYLNEEDLVKAYQASRLFLLTSKIEGLPMVVVEAMSSELPVIVTSVGDLPWLVNDGIEGQIVQHGDTEKMAGFIIKGLNDPEKLRKMGLKARKRIEELLPQFQIEDISKKWKFLLDSCFNKN